MSALALGFIGLLLGVAIFSDASQAFAGAAVGAGLGAALGSILNLFKEQSALGAKLRALESELKALRSGADAPMAPALEPRPAPTPASTTPSTSAAPTRPAKDIAAPAPARQAAREEWAAPAAMATQGQAATEVTEAATAAASAPPPPPPSPPGSGVFQHGFDAARGWLLGGNTVARVGILLLFLGLAFLLRYASERVTLPIEFRYAGVALASFCLLVVGWRLRERRRTYGLLLQGGAVAVLYLTIFAAMHFHPLLPPGMGFALLIAVVVFSAILAVAQDSLVLAAAGAAGGFAAPILTSTGGEHHVALFSYFALLNGGILAVAWFKAWRPLNLIGFVGTLVIGFAWGLRSYRPEMFGTTEPYLVLFFLMYVSIAFLFARRVLGDATGAPPAHDRAALVKWAAQQADYLDGILLFGTPIIGFGLQYALIRDIEYGTAFSALALGLFYMLLAALLLRRTQWRYVALVEVYIALGAVFATLAVPLALDAYWTAAAWAVEGAGVYWIGVKQDRRFTRAFAVLVQFGAAVSYLSTLGTGDDDRLLSGGRLGALMLGAALLFSYWQLRGVPQERRRVEDGRVLTCLAYGGLAFLYLLAPLALAAEGTAIAWAVAGLVTMFLGMRLGDRHWLIGALVIQALAGAVFLLTIPGATDGVAGSVLPSGLHGLFVAGFVGAVALASFALVARDGHAKSDPAVMYGMSLLLLFGLVFVNLAVLFMLPWRIASGVWAASGMAILLISLNLQQRAGFAFGLVLQVIGGGAFIFGAYPALQSLSSAGLRPLWHSGFWTPAVIAMAAYGAAWRLFGADKNKEKTVSGTFPFATLSLALLGWATAWWGFAWLSEIFRFLPAELRPHAALLVTAATVLLWALAARHWQWRAMAALCALSIPAAIVALGFAYHPYYHPAAHLGAVAWLSLLAVHLLVLRLVPDLLPEKWTPFLHIAGCWLFLGIAALEVRFALIALSDHWNAWRWLGWASVPSIYLIVAAQKRLTDFWPFSAYQREYCAIAALPIAAILLAWFWLSNVLSDGTADPLPYLPLVNPLELGQLLVMVALLVWFRERFPMLPFAGQVPAAVSYAAFGASALLFLTCVVLRTCHHWAGIPYTLDQLLASMLVQASLSILWAIAALSLMIVGHSRRQRETWMTGAALIAVVVVKLFLVELFNVGGLPRVISFIGVGVLLLIIGYFAPLPPKRSENEARELTT